MSSQFYIGNSSSTPSILVEIPTVMPLTKQYYLDSNGKLCNPNTFMDLTGINDVGNTVLQKAYANGTLTDDYIDLSGITKLTGSSALNECFNKCSGIKTINMSSLETVSGYYAMYYCFAYSSVENVDFSSLKHVFGNNGMAYCFRESSLKSINLSSLEKIGTYGMHSVFERCNNLTSMRFPSLVTVYGNYGVVGFINGCSKLVSCIFDSLSDISYGETFYYSFYSCYNLKDIYFYALTENSFGTKRNQFSMLSGVTGCTVHFPKNLDPQTGSTIITEISGYPNFQGSNTVLVYDLPSTNHLIGANTIEYERNAKYDTESALAWRVKDTGSGANMVINWTPYYTSTNNDPQVGDMIYSDPECTTIITTVDSIS